MSVRRNHTPVCYMRNRIILAPWEQSRFVHNMGMFLRDERRAGRRLRSVGHEGLCDAYDHTDDKSSPP